MIKTIMIGIHKGDNTHTHDHVITLHNFKTINATKSNPVIPIPELLFDFFDIFLLF